LKNSSVPIQAFLECGVGAYLNTDSTVSPQSGELQFQLGMALGSDDLPRCAHENPEYETSSEALG